jgi:dTDP-4-dehydrorhamnose reductase
VNALGPRWLAEGCRRTGAHLVQVSTDYVFDGEQAEPYREWDRTGPLGVYGASKLAGEHEVLGAGIGATVVRTSWVCGARGSNMAVTVLRLLSGDGPLRFVDDQRGCPTFTEDLAPLLRTLAVTRLPGVVHATNQGPMSWFEFARAVALGAGHDPGRIEPISTAELVPARPARRPANSVLDNAVLRACGIDLLPPAVDGLERLVRRLGAGEP